MAKLRVESNKPYREIRAYYDVAGNLVLRNMRADGEWSRTAMAFSSSTTDSLEVKPVRWSPVNEGEVYYYEGDEVIITL